MVGQVVMWDEGQDKDAGGGYTCSLTIHSLLFIITSTLLEKATLKTKMFLTLLKKGFLVPKFNFLFPKVLIF